MTHNLRTWTDLASASDQDIISWARAQPWARPMATCMQDPIWHAEGDVWTHTQMVCDQLHQLDCWPELSRPTQLKLLLTALLHDSGKPKVTQVEEATGRIRSPKHAQLGMRIARRCLMELQCPLQLREEICHLILFHGRPPYLGKKSTRRSSQQLSTATENQLVELELIRLSNFMDHRLMHLFALTDARGRICETGSREDTIDLWALLAEEKDCLKRPYQFANDHARFLFHRNKLDNLHYVPHENYRCKMTIMVGLPGAGKDTWLQHNRPELPVVSLDGLRQELGVLPTDNQGRVVQAARERCREFLRSHTDFAMNATNTTRQIRQLWTDLGADYNARIEMVYIEPSLPRLIEQNSGRDARVPLDVVQRLIDKLDPPTLAECHELCFANSQEG